MPFIIRIISINSKHSRFTSCKWLHCWWVQTCFPASTSEISFEVYDSGFVSNIRNNVFRFIWFGVTSCPTLGSFSFRILRRTNVRDFDRSIPTESWYLRWVPCTLDFRFNIFSWWILIIFERFTKSFLEIKSLVIQLHIKLMI